MKGGNRLVSYSKPIFIIGDSYDLDLPEDKQTEISFNWKCYNINKDDSCRIESGDLLQIP